MKLINSILLITTFGLLITACLFEAMCAEITLPISGTTTSSTTAVSITNNGSGRGIYALTLLGDRAIFGENKKNGGTGIYGIANAGATSTGVYGVSQNGRGVVGVTYNGEAGVKGANTKVNGVGIWGIADTGTTAKGVYGASSAGYGIYGTSNTGFAGYFQGNVNITGELTVGSLSLPAGSISTEAIGINAITSDKILDGTITGADILSDTISADKIQPNIISSLNSVTSDGGNIDLVAGDHISISTDMVDKTITISATDVNMSLPYNGSTSSNETAFQITSSGNAIVGDFVNTNTSSSITTLHAENYGSGHTLAAVNKGTGESAYFYNTNSANPNSCLTIGTAGSGPALAAWPGTGLAGLFYGNVSVLGTLSKSAGSFKIDHPLDPENKYLSHSFVESPDMKNVYDGVVVLDENGEAWVQLPEYFQALNKDFRYQLTCIGGFAPVYIARKVESNRFKIAGGQPGLEVSWQVTGIRQDAYANAHRIPVEENKPASERGKYLNPEAFGLPKSSGISVINQVF